MEELEAKVKEALDAFRPQLQADGGDTEFLSIDEQKRVHLKLTGACGSCQLQVHSLLLVNRQKLHVSAVGLQLRPKRVQRFLNLRFKFFHKKTSFYAPISCEPSEQRNWKIRSNKLLLSCKQQYERTIQSTVLYCQRQNQFLPPTLFL